MRIKICETEKGNAEKMVWKVELYVPEVNPGRRCKHMLTCSPAVSVAKLKGVLASDGRLESKVERSNGLKEAMGSGWTGGTAPGSVEDVGASEVAHGLQYAHRERQRK